MDCASWVVEHGMLEASWCHSLWQVTWKDEMDALSVAEEPQRT